MRWEIKSYFGRNLLRAVRYIVTSPITIVGCVGAALSLISILEKLFDLGLGACLSLIVAKYREVFHYPFFLLARYFHLDIPVWARDLVVIWIGMSACYARANSFIVFDGPRVLTPPGPREIIYRGTYFHIQSHGREHFTSPFWHWCEVKFMAWQQVSNRMMPKGFDLKEQFKSLVYNAWVALTLPFLVFYVSVFDDFLIRQRVTYVDPKNFQPVEENYYEHDPDGDYMTHHITREIEISLRFLFLTQLALIVLSVVCLTAF